MKTIAFTVGLVMLSLGARSQSIMDKLYDKCSGMDGYTTVYISKYMFDMFRSNNNNEAKSDEDMGQILGKLNCIKILATDDDPNTPAPVNLYQEIMKVLPSNHAYKEIMVVNDKGQNVKFYARDEKGKVAELLMVVGGKDQGTLISIQGDIDMKNISKLASGFNVEGMENLKDMDQEKK
jgi:hypothetical protein